ncbi:hypothetical protein BX666DRAFT_2000015 [Dichotomocladium elegans]|nr:hypothetical protein BX666DRAFT_2000015 [Dichotomocladium elegans]
MDRLISPDKDCGAWDLITDHLISTANFTHTPPTIRTQACEAIADIVIAAMDHILSQQKEPDEHMQTRLLKALDQCINYTPNNNYQPHDEKQPPSKTFPEVQRMGLETLNKLLQTSGHSFTCGWSLIFEMVKHVTTTSPSIQLDTASAIDEELEVIDDEIRTERASIDTTNSSLRVVTTSSGGGPSRSSGGLIKVAFASLQLICTDFLGLLSPDCLRQCIATLGAFGMQSEDINISLTAVGLLWNLSDFIQTKHLELEKKDENMEVAEEEDVITKEMLNIDQALEAQETPANFSILWMLLLLQLSHVCTDPRPEVRNGANQTLFRTIMMNGNVLSRRLWSACIWEVLFPLLDAIKMSSIRAVKMMQAQAARSPSLSPLADRDPSGFLLHHSRDTADKQWDETKVLVISGISGIFRDFLGKLYTLPKFDRAWSLLLAHLEDSCLRSSQEVSLASIKSFQNIASQRPDCDCQETVTSLWNSAWVSWLSIGQSITAPREEGEDELQTRRKQLDSELHPLTLSLSSSSAATISEDFSQDMLTVYVGMFTDLYSVISATFSLADVESMLVVLKDILVYSTSPQYRTDIDNLSPLQEAVLKVIRRLDMDVPGIPALVLRDLSVYMTLGFVSLQQENGQKANGSTSTGPRRFTTVTYIALNKKATKLVVEYFKSYADDLSLYSEGVFERIIGAFGLPMKLKYDCPPSFKHGDDKTPLWKFATTGLLDILRLGLEKLHGFGEDVPLERFVGVWRTLVDVLHGSLLSPSTPPSTMTIEELDVDEHFDISVLSVIQSDIVIFIGEERVPDEVIGRLVDLLRESSRLYYVDEVQSHHHDDLEDELATKESDEGNEVLERTSDILGTTGTIVPVMKEAFAYAALRTLFALCSSDNQDHVEVRRRIARATVPVLLERCETILRNYTADEPLLGRCPFPRYLNGVRKEEILFFLKQSIKLKLQKDILGYNETDQGVARQLLLSGPRGHLFYLYPTLCKMITCDDSAVVALIRDCLEVAGSEIGLSR